MAFRFRTLSVIQATRTLPCRPFLPNRLSLYSQCPPYPQQLKCSNFRSCRNFSDNKPSSPSGQRPFISPESEKWVIGKIKVRAHLAHLFLLYWLPKSFLLLKAIIVTIPIFLLGGVYYAYYANRIREKNIRSAFDKGAVPTVEESTFVERKKVSQDIESIIQPRKGYSNYDLIVGNHGTGKTTLVRKVGHEHHGIIYVDVPENLSFDMAFKKALRWSPPITSWSDVLLKKIFQFEKPREGEIYRLY